MSCNSMLMLKNKTLLDPVLGSCPVWLTLTTAVLPESLWDASRSQLPPQKSCSMPEEHLLRCPGWDQCSRILQPHFKLNTSSLMCLMQIKALLFIIHMHVPTSMCILYRASVS